MAEATAVQETTLSSPEAATPATPEVTTTPVVVEDTGNAATAQAVSDPETPATPSVDLESDPEIVEAVRRMATAQLEAERSSMRTELEREIRGDAAKQARDEEVRQAQAELKALAPQTLREMREELKGFTFTDEYGRPATIPEEVIEKAFGRFHGYNGKALDAARREVFNGLEGEVFELVDDEQAFATDAHGKPFKEWMGAAIEHGAAKSNYVKGLSLEDAIKLSPKLKADVEAIKATEFTRGRTKGQADPSGAPRASERIGGTGLGWSTKREARDLHAQGKLTNSEMRRINADPSVPGGYV